MKAKLDVNDLALADLLPADPMTGEPMNKAKGSKPPARFNLIDHVELYTPVDPMNWVIDGVAAPGCLTELMAFGSSGKTWLAIAAGVSAAAGVPWLGRFATRQVGAVFLDWESGRREMRRRTQMIVRGLGLGAELPPFGVASFSQPYLDDTAALAEAIGALAADYGLVVIDSFMAACPSLQENDSSARRYLDSLKGLAETHKLAILILTHAKKTSGSPVKIDPREAGRGSSAIFDAADLVFAGTYVEGEPLHVTQTKARLGRKVDPFDVTIADTPDGAILVTARDPERGETTPDEAFSARKSAVRDFIRRHPGIAGNEAIAARMRLGRPTVAQAVRELLDEGRVVDRGTKSPRRPKLYVTHEETPIHE